MSIRKLAVDPLWQALCPSWSNVAGHSTPLVRFRRRQLQSLQCVNAPRQQSRLNGTLLKFIPSGPYVNVRGKPDESRDRSTKLSEVAWKSSYEDPHDLASAQTPSIYARLRSDAAEGRFEKVQRLVEYLVQERGEEPNLQLYNALIMVNVSHDFGAAWRIGDLLDEMRNEGLQPDVATCHAVLKVLSVHVDHLLRDTMLQYMQEKWIELSAQGAQDVAAGMLREGLIEQALARLDAMKRDGMRIDPWLLDVFVYALCDAGEVDEAYKIMRPRRDKGELNISRAVWTHLLESAADRRHHAATLLVWNGQVKQRYLTPSSTTCLNVLATAAHAGDPGLATDVFGHLGKRGTPFQAVHYELLISTYLAQEKPDFKRGLNILTIMALENFEPTRQETRALYLYMRRRPTAVAEAFKSLQDLHAQDRRIPIAALNLIIECYIEQENLAEALKVYKLVHTFAPVAQAPRKTLANIETFNLLLKGCRQTLPPDAEQASFLVSELLALKIKPTALTFDRLILVLVNRAKHHRENPPSSAEVEIQTLRKELLDWAFHYFAEMHNMGLIPRYGTIELLSQELAIVSDKRCWDVLQIASDIGDSIDGWKQKGEFAKSLCERSWISSINGLVEEQSVQNEADSAVSAKAEPLHASTEPDVQQSVLARSTG